jgi:hypothetical protein
MNMLRLCRTWFAAMAALITIAQLGLLVLLART